MNSRCHSRSLLAVPLLLLLAVSPVFASAPPAPGGDSSDRGGAPPKQCFLVPGRTPGSNAKWDSFLGQAAHRIIAYMYIIERPGRQI